MKIEIIDNFSFKVTQDPKANDSRLDWRERKRYTDCVVRSYRCNHCYQKILERPSINYKIEQLIEIQQDETFLEIHLMQCSRYRISKKPHYNNDISK